MTPHLGRLVFVIGLAVSSQQPAFGQPPAKAGGTGAAAQRPRTDSQGDPLPPGAVARLGTVRWRHPGGITAIAFAPDGQSLATGGSDQTVRLWEVASGREYGRLQGFRAAIAGLVFTPDGKTLIAAERSGSLLFWDTATRKLLRRLPQLQSDVQYLALSRDGKTLASAGGGQVLFGEAATGRPLRPMEQIHFQMHSISFSPDGKLLAVVGYPGMIHIAEVATGKVVRRFQVPPWGENWKERLEQPGASFVAAAFSADGKCLIAPDCNWHVYVLEISTGRRLRRFSERASGAPVAFALDGKMVAFGSYNEGWAVLADSTATRHRSFRSAERHGRINALAFSPDGKLLATGGDDAVVGLWDTATGKPLHPASGQELAIGCAALAPDGKIVASFGWDWVLRLWGASSGKELARLGKAEKYVSYLAFSPDGKSLVAGGWDSVPQLWDLSRGTVMRRFEGAGQFIVSPDGKALLNSGPLGDLLLWEVATGKKLHRLRGHSKEQEYWAAAFSPNGKLLATAGTDNTVGLWQVATGKELRRFQTAALWGRSLVFSPDGRNLFFGGEAQHIRRWDTATGDELPRILTGTDRCTLLSYPPGGTTLAAVGDDSALFLWDMTRGKLRRRSLGHQGGVTDISFAADGKTLLSTGRDGTALVWDVARLIEHGQPREDLAKKPPVPPSDYHGDPLPDGALARLGSVRWRRSGTIASVVFSADGKILVAGGGGNEESVLTVWDAATGKELRRLDGVAYGYTHVAFSPAGSVLAVSSDGRVDCWDVATGRLLHQLAADPHYVYALAFAPDGKTLAAAGGTHEEGKRNTIGLWDVATGNAVRRLEGHATAITALTFTADGRLLSTSGDLSVSANNSSRTVPGRLCLWDVASGKKLHERRNNHGYPVLAPGGGALAFRHEDKSVRLVDPLTGRERSRLAVQDVSLAFSPDGAVVATGNAHEMVRLWDAATGKELRRFEGHLGHGTYVANFSPDGKVLATTDYNGAVRLWDVAAGRELCPFDGHLDTVGCVACSADGRTVATSGPDRTIRLWEAATGKGLRHWRGHEDGVAALAFAPDGKALASAGKDGTAALWEVATGKELRRLLAGPGGVRSLAFAAAGRLLVTGGRDGTVRKWDAASGKEVGRFSCHPEEVAFIVFSADGEWLACAGGNGRDGSGDGEVRLWRVATGKELPAIDLGKDPDAFNSRLLCWAVAFSPDGRLLATSESLETRGLRSVLSRHTIRVWEIATRTEVMRMEGQHAAARALAFSPDGLTLAHGHGRTGSWGWGREQTVLLRDLSTGRNLQLLAADGGDVACLTTGRQLRPLAGHTNWVASVCFAPDGKYLVTGSGDRTALVWDCARFHVERRAAPDLTANELETLWSDLSGAEAAPAYRAIARLAAVPARSVPFVQQRLRPVTGVDARQIARHITNLGDERFAVRQKAMLELEKLGEWAEPALRQALEGRPPLETRRRVEQLLDKLERAVWTPEQLRASRALAVLERAGTAAARQTLAALTQGAPEARLTQEAQAILRRMNRRSFGGP
jgi:WD40 repeat protein